LYLFRSNEPKEKLFVRKGKTITSIKTKSREFIGTLGTTKYYSKSSFKVVFFGQQQDTNFHPNLN
jgi:hypothetical protein